MYNAYVTQIKNLHKHPNADRLQIGECFGNAVIVSLDYVDSQLGIYFPSDGQLSVEFCEINHLCRKKIDGTPDTGYMDPDKRNVTAIKLRGEKSDGLFLPLHSLESFGDISTLCEGDKIDVFNGHEICKKYVPRKRDYSQGYFRSEKIRKKKIANIAPLFAEHADTEQLAYNLNAFKAGDEIEITLKMHGTSQRTGYLPTLKGYKKSLMDKILRREGKPIYEWGYVSGTRRTVLEDFEGGYYGSNEFREAHSKIFEGKLNKGETVYYEVVGFTTDGNPIMGNCSNKKLNDKDFVKQYGEETIFSYGCEPDGKKVYYGRDEDGDYEIHDAYPQSDIYVYRMTMTNEDGFVVEYTPDFMRYRCEQIGIKTVPVFWRGFIPVECEDADFLDADLISPPGEWAKELAEAYYDGPDPVGKTHVREGVVVRIINRPKFCAYKHKNFSFKCLEGIVKVEAETPDIEEAQEVTNESV